MIHLTKDVDFLSEEFLGGYSEVEPKWGFASGPNSLGEITYRRTYSREGEAWWQTVRRVVEGTYEILYSHCKYYNLPFDIITARRDAEAMFDLIFNFKFLPPGRGLWVMGTDHVRKVGGMALNNCAFVSTKDIDIEFDEPFRFLMDVSMLGVGCGFDTRGANKIVWDPSRQNTVPFQIADSREGWVDSVGAVIKWGFGIGPKPDFDYSLIRPKGSVIKGFGGVSEGPEPLKLLHETLEKIIIDRSGEYVNSRDITDIMNLIGRCVVAGNVRRSAEIAIGEPDDQAFINLKNYEMNPDRAEYGWLSNNSLYAYVGMDYSAIADRIADNGEPGLVWLDNMRAYSRMSDKPDNKDHRVVGTNPCAEQSLETYEVCNLVETFPFHHKNIEEYRTTLKHAFIYAKAVSLIPTHWAKTNAVMLRNRRIGTSMSGVAQFVAHRNEKNLIRWSKIGYNTIEHYDRVYSEWLCVRESIKKTSVKPSGTVSLLAGATPGVHYPTQRYYIRRIRFAAQHPDVTAFVNAGYKVEPDVNDPQGTVVVEFPVAGDDKVPTEVEVSLEDKVDLAILMQEYWADNQVSCTATFNPATEKDKIYQVLKNNEKSLKSISFLPILEMGAYAQMPYEAITKDQYTEMIRDLKKITWGTDSTHDQQDTFCDSQACEIPALAALRKVS
jgi:adenosylcobalamin-dependent ribonucleoside-triphosphate reductase